MRDLTITAIIKVYQYDELNEADRALVTTAKEATARSYVCLLYTSKTANIIFIRYLLVTPEPYSK